MARSSAIARGRGWVVFALALGMGIAVLAPGRTHACEPIAPGTAVLPRSQDQTELHWGIAIASVATVDATVIVLEAVAGADMFPAWGAGLELGLGITETIAGSILTTMSVTVGAFSCGGSDWFVQGISSGVAMMVVGGWLIAHASWSLHDGDGDIEITPTVSLGPDGAVLGAIATF